MEGLASRVPASIRRGRRLDGAQGRPRQPFASAAHASGYGASEEGGDGTG